jgi:hypothetical protein
VLSRWLHDMSPDRQETFNEQETEWLKTQFDAAANRRYVSRLASDEYINTSY